MRIETRLDDNLRECPVDSARLRQAVQESSTELSHLRSQTDASTLSTTRLGRRLQRHGRYRRLQGRFDDALSLKDEACKIWSDCERRKAHFLCQLQKSVILFEARRIEAALDAAEMLETRLDDETAVYRDMVAEALGKCHFGGGDRRRAVEYLEEALDIRLQRGNERHIERTRHLIDIVERSGK